MTFHIKQVLPPFHIKCRFSFKILFYYKCRFTFIIHVLNIFLKIYPYFCSLINKTKQNYIK